MSPKSSTRPVHPPSATRQFLTAFSKSKFNLFTKSKQPQPILLPRRFDDSFGDEISTLNGRRRWRLAGTALSTWKRKLPIILEIRNNTELISAEAYLGIHCWMIGYDKERAHPTVIVSSEPEYHSTAVNLLKLIEKLGTLRSEGFKARTMAGSVSLSTGSTDVTTAQVSFQQRNSSICGADVFVQQSKKHATVCCLLEVDEKLSLVTVAHAFTAETKNTKQTFDNGSGPRFYQDEWENDEEEDDYRESFSQEKAISEKQDYFSDSGVSTDWIEQADGQRNSLKTKPVSFTVSKICKIAEGCDWALLSTDNQTLTSRRLQNTVEIQDSDKQILLTGVDSAAPTGEVWIVSRRGIMRGIGSGTSTIINLGSSIRYREAWTIEVRAQIELGDSGSIVINPLTGSVYGMLVATSHSLQEAYVIPMTDILDDIRMSIPGVRVVFPTPSARLEANSSTSKEAPLESPHDQQNEPPLPRIVLPMIIGTPEELSASFPPTEMPETTHLTPRRRHTQSTESRQPLRRPARNPQNKTTTSLVSRLQSPKDSARSSFTVPSLKDDAALGKESWSKDSWSSMNVLTCGGGGIRGYASLLIIEKLMEQISVLEKDTGRSLTGKTVENPVPALLPCHYFDFIAGTSTGGLIAIMLGRLRMSVEEALSAYENIAEHGFGHPRLRSSRGPIWWPGRPKYDSILLENAIKRVVGQERFYSPPELCKSAVLAMDRRRKRPRLFCSDDLSSEELIWEAARATSAAPTYFKPIDIGGIEYEDGGLIPDQLIQLTDVDQYWNIPLPTYEGHNIIMSVGTEEPPTSRLCLGFRDCRVRTSCTRCPLGPMDNRPHSKYVRFNIHEGLGKLKLDEWKESGWRRKYSTKETLSRAVEAEINKEGVIGELRNLAEVLVRRRREREAADPDRWKRFAYSADLEPKGVRVRTDGNGDSEPAQTKNPRLELPQSPVATRDENGIRTSDIRLEALHMRQPRLHVASFNGTLGGEFGDSRTPVVSAFVKLFAKSANVDKYEVNLNGGGTDGSWTDWMWGSVAGVGTLRDVVITLKNLSRGYYAGDRIIAAGYSRGAWAARYLAFLISVIGIPKNGDDRLFYCIYEACHDKTIWEEGVAAKLLEGYDCWDDVRINALCCFDTVGSLGFPLIGLITPLNNLRRWSKKHQIISDISPNVDYAFHALALHEQRKPYHTTLMRASPSTNLYQVYFPGSHSDLGWIYDTESLVQGPLAWMVQQVHQFLGVQFSDRELAACFPSYRPESAEEPTREGTWYNGNIKPSNSALLPVIGRKGRQPGRINPATGLTNVKIHIGARLRNRSMLEGDTGNIVPGYALQAPITGIPFWALRRGPSHKLWLRPNSRESQRTGSSSLDGSSSGRVQRIGTGRIFTPAPKTADRVEEAPVGALEARCLGLPLSVVRDSS